MSGRLTPEDARTGLAREPLLLELFDERMRGTGDWHSGVAMVVRSDGASDTAEQLSCQGDVQSERGNLQAGQGDARLLKSGSTSLSRQLE